LHHEVALIKDFQRAIDEKEFKLHYQPKVDIESGKIVGAEALIRWEHKTKGLLSPDSFINLSEKTGHILQLGKFVIDNSAQYIAHLNSLGFKDTKISINVSLRQFQDLNLVNYLANALERENINNHQLSIEITESIMIDDIDFVVKKLNEIKNLGIDIYMDDFGTGYSSLSYLKHLPIDVLKIDKTFIDDISENFKNDTIILNTILAMGQTLNLSIIAEGIEYEYQLNYLKNKNCDYYQGYYFSKALTEEDFINLLENNL